ncbi:class I SAM-dependent methyltransferase [Vibrio vulnificus]|uniref:class I SAM-dependent methyltransferase n=1 Tax=Vibrio vulnificus TaxID=672 RepID=UPI0032EE970B
MNNWNPVANKVQFNLEISTKDLIDHAPISSSILDFGCGYGRISNQLYSLGYRKIVGVDSSEEMINRGGIDFPHLDLRFSNADTLPFPDAKFDVVFTCAVFTCIDQLEKRQRVFDELTRVTKSNGIIYMAEFSSPQSTKFVSGQGVPMWHSSHHELEKLASKLVIEVSRQTDTNTMTGHKSGASHIIARKTI